MPQGDDHDRCHDGEILRSAPHPTEGDEDVALGEPGQAHVPRIPELLGIRLGVRRREVGLQLETEQPADTDRQVRVAGEVEVEVPGEEEQLEPHEPGRVHAVRHEHLDGRPQRPGENEDLHQTDEDLQAALQEVLARGPAGGVGVGCDLLVLHHRPDDLDGREEAEEEQAVCGQRIDEAQVGLHEEIDRPERGERQTERQDDLADRIDLTDRSGDIAQPRVEHQVEVDDETGRPQLPDHHGCQGG